MSEPLTQKLGKRRISGRPANCTSNEHFKPNPSVSTLPSNSSKKTCPPTSDNFCKSVPLYEGGGGEVWVDTALFFIFFSCFPEIRKLDAE